MGVSVGTSRLDRRRSSSAFAGREGGEPISVAFVNNMPDAAFEETEQQFRALLDAGAGNRPVSLHRYVLTTLPRGDALRARIRESYFGLDHLYANPPDALIITGAEPHFPDMRSEPYWAELEHLLGWTAATVPSALLSCLASHAALLALDGIQRTPLAVKCSGVFPQETHDEHPLICDVGPVAYPHSRLNAVETSVLTAHGYTVLLDSPDAGWTVAVGHSGRCLFVLFQGHPEYSPSTLLREYRRDVRRFLDRQRPAYPQIPHGYLDPTGVRLLKAFESSAKPLVGDVAPMEMFPFDHVARHIRVDWHGASSTLMGNWLREVERRSLPVGARS